MRLLCKILLYVTVSICYSFIDLHLEIFEYFKDEGINYFLI